MIKTNIEQFGLIEKNTYVITGITYNLAAANFMIEKTLGTFFLIPGFQNRYGFESLTESYWDFCFDTNTRRIYKHDFRAEISAAEYYSSIKNKLKALEEVSRNSQIQKNRYKGNNNDLTDLILITREQQAKNYLSGFQDDFCYVEEYAKGNDMSLDQAAEDIIVRSKLMHKDLARIEGMKYLYFNKIFNCDDMAEIKEIVNQFARECWFSN